MPLPDRLDLPTQIGVYLEDTVAFALTEPSEAAVRHVHPATGFDPQALGAQCSRCPLRHPSRPPVGADLPADGLAPDFAIVGEAPGPTETQSGRPFDGPSGRLLEQLGARAGLHRSRALVTNAVACMPPGMDFGTFEARYHLENSDRRRANQQPLPHPMDCCRPRLEVELRGIRDVISMGARGMNALLPGTRKSLDALRGGPLVLRRDLVGGKWVVEGPDGPTGQIAQWEERRLLPTVHPARLFPGREPKWTGPFISDMAKAVRFFAGRLTWVDPPYSVNPPVEEIMRSLGVVWQGGQFEAPPELARPLSYDFEADRREPLLANVRCLGIGNRQGSVVAAFLSRDGRTRFWSPEKEGVVRAVIRAWALGPGLKIGWNSEGYDSLLFWAWMGIVPTPQLDGMIVQKDLEPEMPHNLGYAGSVLTDVRAWKAGKEAVDDDEVKDDESLFRYNNVDVAATHTCTEVYAAEAVRRGLLRWTSEGRLDPECIIGLDHEKARVCRTMHINGMLVDQTKRAELFVREADKVEKHAAACRKIAEDPSLNINSNGQIARLLFSRACWHLPYNPEYTTAAGLPSVSEPQTRWLLQQAFLGDQQRAWLMSYRRCKAADKLRGTYLSRTAPVLEDEERATETRKAENKAAIALRAARDLWPRAGADVWVPFAGPAERSALMAALYEDWGLAPVLTKTGRPSASRDSLVTLWQRGVRDVPRRFLSAVLSYRRHVDEVKRLRKPPEEDEYERCTIWEDGRVHAQWKAIGAATGRLASQPNMQNCFLPDTTDVLTRRGWVRVENLLDDDDVAQWTPGPSGTADRGRIEFVRPLARISRLLEPEKALRLATRAWRSSTTAGHRIPVVTRKGALEVRAAEDMIGDRKIVHGGQYVGGDVEPGDAWITLLCAAQADGHFRSDGGDWLFFTFTKQRKIDRLVAAARDAGVAYETSPKRGYDQTRVKLWGPAVGELRRALRWDPTRVVGETRSVYKAFGSWLLDWTFRALDRFCTEILFWDGRWTRKNQYASAVRENTEWVQTAYALTGQRKAHFHRYVSNGGSVSWQVYLSSKAYSWSTNFERHEVSLPEDTPVYCVTVPSGFLLVRSEDQIHVSGNCPKGIRSMYVPGVGHVFVSADSDQVEMRLIAIRWGLSRYLEAFAQGLDPHQITMHLVWGDEMWGWEGAPKVRFFKDSAQAEKAGKNGNHGAWEIGGYFDKEARTLAKVLFYASAYSALLPTVYDIITSAADKEGNLMFLHLTLDDVERMHSALLKNCSEMAAGWESELAHFRQHGYIMEPVRGRACWFLDGEDPSKMFNFPIQSSAASLIDTAMLAIDAKYPLRFAGPNTGLVAQVHDQLTLEVPREIAPQVARDLQDAMTGTCAAYPGMQFGAKASVKEVWA